MSQRLTTVGWAYDPDLADEEQLLERFGTLTGWSEAVREAGLDDVTVVQRFHRDSTFRRNGVTYRFCRDSGGPRLPPWTASPAVAAAVTASTPAIVHVNGLGFPLQTWRLRRQLPSEIALVVQDHASGAPRPIESRLGAQMRHVVRRRAMRAPDAYFFTAADQADPWRDQDLMGQAQRICAVPEGSTRMRPVPIDTARAMSGVVGDPAVLWVGRLNANKDPLTVVDACAQAQRHRTGLTLTMVFGADDLLAEIQLRLASYPQLAPRVRLVGEVAHDALPAFYSAADIFVLGSHHEGSGYALIEACACGAAPAVTDIPAFRALTRDGAGQLWTPGDAGACASAVLRLAGEPRAPQRARVRKHFDRALSWPAVGRQACAAYDQVIRERHART